jgi:hypothetical protein
LVPASDFFRCCPGEFGEIFDQWRSVTIGVVSKDGETRFRRALFEASLIEKLKNDLRPPGKILLSQRPEGVSDREGCGIMGM